MPKKRRPLTEEAVRDLNERGVEVQAQVQAPSSTVETHEGQQGDPAPPTSSRPGTSGSGASAFRPILPAPPPPTSIPATTSSRLKERLLDVGQREEIDFGRRDLPPIVPGPWDQHLRNPRASATITSGQLQRQLQQPAPRLDLPGERPRLLQLCRPPPLPQPNQAGIFPPAGYPGPNFEQAPHYSLWDRMRRELRDILDETYQRSAAEMAAAAIQPPWTRHPNQPVSFYPPAILGSSLFRTRRPMTAEMVLFDVLPKEEPKAVAAVAALLRIQPTDIRILRLETYPSPGGGMARKLTLEATKEYDYSVILETEAYRNASSFYEFNTLVSTFETAMEVEWIGTALKLFPRDPRHLMYSSFRHPEARKLYKDLPRFTAVPGTYTWVKEENRINYS